jgi:hypothetical protein
MGAELAGAADTGPPTGAIAAIGVLVVGYGTYTMDVGPVEAIGEAVGADAAGAAGVIPEISKLNAEESTEITVIVSPVEVTTPPWTLSVLGNFPPEPGPIDMPAVHRSPASPMFTFFSMSYCPSTRGNSR